MRRRTNTIVTISVANDLLADIDDVAAQAPGPRNRSRTVARLIRAGLAHEPRHAPVMAAVQPIHEEMAAA
jgi:hypothetical protein